MHQTKPRRGSATNLLLAGQLCVCAPPNLAGGGEEGPRWSRAKPVCWGHVEPSEPAVRGTPRCRCRAAGSVEPLGVSSGGFRFVGLVAVQRAFEAFESCGASVEVDDVGGAVGDGAVEVGEEG